MNIDKLIKNFFINLAIRKYLNRQKTSAQIKKIKNLTKMKSASLNKTSFL